MRHWLNTKQIGIGDRSEQWVWSESEQWVWCVNIEARSSRTQTIPDSSEKDVTSRNQTHALKKRTGRVPCDYSFSYLLHRAETFASFASLIKHIMLRTGKYLTNICQAVFKSWKRHHSQSILDQST